MPKLLRTVKAFYKKEGRNHLPWRKIRDPYKILVSEVMLQQTQVKRVLPLYVEFIKRFPTVQSLAKAPLSKVLRTWQGLGYNRRAKYLHGAAKAVVKEYKGIFPKKVVELEQLPGIGPYTARAVSAFAYNKSEVFIETNIRTVFIYFCFTTKSVSDKEILLLIAEALKKSKMEPRDFYAALMDYGTYLKQSGIKLNSRSKHYIKQSKFKDSTRQLRGAILRELVTRPATLSTLTKNLSRKRGEVSETLTQLSREGFITSRRGRFLLVS